MQRLLVAAVAALLVAGIGPARAGAQDCCGGKPSKAGADAVSGKPVRWVTLRLGAPPGDGAKTIETLKGLPEVAAAELTESHSAALLALPTAFVDFPGLEKALAGKGIAGTLVNPVRLTLKLVRADGKVDARSLCGSYAMASGVIATAADAAGDALVAYLDPEAANLQEVTEVATQHGYQVEVTSHAVLRIPVPDRFCGDCRAQVGAALAGTPGVTYVVADEGAGDARVWLEKGKTDAKQLAQTLAAAGWDGKRAERPEACPKCHNRK